MRTKWSADAMIAEWLAGDTSGCLRGDECSSAWAGAVRGALEETLCNISAIRERVKSPIEELFAATAWARNGWFGLNRALIEDGSNIVCVHDPSLPEVLQIEPQAAVGKYKCDFLLTLKWYASKPTVSVRVAVELDGHDFHEKSKQQAAHDKKRDRFFAAQGLTVLRFTGSEIVRSPESCVDEVFQLLSGKMKELMP